jgi:hypothetical protein
MIFYTSRYISTYLRFPYINDNTFFILFIDLQKDTYIYERTRKNSICFFLEFIQQNPAEMDETGISREIETSRYTQFHDGGI